MIATDDQLREYLLGIADSLMREHIEEELFHNDAQLDRLEFIQDELIDEYVFGQLSTRERSQFERHFLRTAERRQRVEHSKSVRQYAIKHAIGRSARSRLMKYFNVSSAVEVHKWKIVAVFCTCSILACTWLAEQDMILRSELKLLRRSGKASEQIMPPQLPQASNTSSLTQSREAPLPSPQNGEQSKNKLGGLLLPSIVITPGLSRGIEEENRIALLPNAILVRIILRTPEISRTQLREALSNASGNRVWIQETTVSNAEIDGQRLVIYVPANVLKPGNYQISLSEKAGNGEYDDLASYGFRVVRADSRP